MKLAGCCSELYVRTPQSSLRLASSPKGEPRNTSLQTPYLKSYLLSLENT
ncbi:hypothetical protein RUMCAL_01611 [Ruminococcus callidus ATCC 27760]|uniref:Uncharacterized protein n=1 Tax=Ruminococcus callidus ATCC 27760 TaxID=411473 RepID=U2M1S3_9FIRM|nr:hypothetical protein RUMCAL_01611 [Ruminococcus callidus ATCC 27760]